MKFLRSLTLTLMALGMAGTAWAEQLNQRPRLGKIDNDKLIDVNNIAMFVTNRGSFAWDVGTGASGLEFPKGTGKTAVFAAGPWIAGKVNGEIRVAIAEYRFEFAPGPILPDGTPADPQSDRYRVYKINRGDGPENPDYAQWPVEDGAPVNADGTPMMLGDQMLWAVYNDADPGVHTGMQTAPLGVEIQQTTFAFNRTGPLGNVVFIKFLILNKGGNTIDSTYVSLWSDPDLGQADNDLVGCDVETSLGFCYNGSNTDSQYGSSPPAVGYDFFKGPIGDDGEELPMTSFSKYINGTDPNTAEETYNYMKGIDADGTVTLHTDPITGQVKAFMVDGDPVAGTGWNDENPADRRLMLTAGPFTFAPGDTQEVVGAIILGQGQDRLTSITAARFNDTFAQSAFDANFELPSPPPAPKVLVATTGDHMGNGKIQLTWGKDSEVSGGDYAFEGYNVYQGESVAGPWRRIATFDMINGSAIIFDNQFDEGSGVVVNSPAQFGGDSGIRHYIELTEDKVLGGRLITGKTYFFAVTAYSLNESRSPKTLETALAPLADGRMTFKPLSDELIPANGIVPRSPTAGTRFNTVGVDSSVAHTQGSSDGIVAVQVVDETRVTGASYEVRFRETDEGTTVWDLVNLSSGQAVLSDMVQHATLDEAISNPIVEGLLVRVTGPPLGIKDWEIPSGARWYTWAGNNWGGEGFRGAMTGDVAHYWFGPTSVPPARLVNVELRFTSVIEDEGEDQYKPIDLTNPNVSWGYRYLRGASAPPPAPADQTTTKAPYDWSNYIINTSGPGVYVYQERNPIALAAWDVENNRRLEVGWLENNQTGGLVNGAYGPAYYDDINNLAGAGPREWLFIFDRTYTEPGDDTNVAELSQGLINADPAPPIMYIVFASRRQADRFPQDGDSFLIYANHVNSSNDVFSFNTQGALLNDLALAAEDLTKILAVPNPYLGRSSYELSSLARQMRFTNLPAFCTIRIFSLAGDLVRTISHNNGLSFDTWDLKTDQGVLVSSGVYIAHFDAPGIGTHFIKCAVFMESEALNSF